MLENRNGSTLSITSTRWTPNASALRSTAAPLWGSCRFSITRRRPPRRAAAAVSMRARRSSSSSGASAAHTAAGSENASGGSVNAQLPRLRVQPHRLPALRRQEDVTAERRLHLGATAEPEADRRRPGLRHLALAPVPDARPLAVVLAAARLAGVFRPAHA